MEVITATDAKQKFGAVLDAVQRGPVFIQRQNRDVAVMLSPQTYKRLRGIQLDQFDRLRTQLAEEARANGLTEEILAEILAE